MRGRSNAETRLLVLLCLGWSFLLCPARAGASAVITSLNGLVEVRSAGSEAWEEASVNRTLNPGDEVRTPGGSRCSLVFDDGSKVQIGPKSSFILEEAQGARASMRFGMGWMKAWVSKALSRTAGRRFVVRTPTAVCSVRGTEFDVRVGEGGNTSVELFRGLLAVADNQGNERLLNPGERVDVDQGGMRRTQSAEEAREAEAEHKRREFKREVGLDMSKEEVQAAAALEQKNAIYQQGKAMIDVNGHRVRLEEYIIRPKPDQFKLVVLNERADRFDYFYYLGTFNKSLPQDISAALRQLPGCIGTPCDFWLSRFETGRSNTLDHVLENASGGHLVDVNNNGVAADAVTVAFDPAKNEFSGVAVPNLGGTGNTPFYTALFDTYSLSYGQTGAMTAHVSWSPAVAAYNASGCSGGVGPACGGIQNMGGSDRTLSLVTQLVSPPGCTELDKCTGYRDPSRLHQVIYSQNGAGTIWDKYDNYIISDEGDVAKFSDFGSTKGRGYKENLLKWNYQQIVTASEFQGRKIDLVFEPKILIESGLIP